MCQSTTIIPTQSIRLGVISETQEVIVKETVDRGKFPANAAWLKGSRPFDSHERRIAGALEFNSNRRVYNEKGY